MTATRRLARWIKAECDAEQAAAGREAWLSADVLHWSGWVRRSWLRLRDWGGLGGETRLLSPAQGRILWRQVLSDLPPLQGAVLPGDAAGVCERAWSLCQEYGLEPAAIAAEGGVDVRHFAQAAAAYRERCRGPGWQDAGALAGSLAEYLDRHAGQADLVGLADRLVLVGFDLLAPIQSQLLERLTTAGIVVEHLASAGGIRKARSRCIACDDGGGEILAAAAWARSRLEENPRARIGIVLARPDETLDAVANVLDDVLSPGRVLPDRGPGQGRWDLYLDRPLDDWPVVAAALRALSFVLSSVPLTEAGLLLRSPFLAGADEEADARAALDARLRRAGYFDLDPDALLDALDHGPEPERADCPLLRSALEEAAAGIGKAATPRRADEWARRFGDLLSALGWPGDKSPDSAEFQTVRRWHEALVEFGGCEPLLGMLNGDEALHELTRFVREIRFQPEAEPVPVQVMGLLDAGGLDFDACWVAGLEDAALPRPLSPHPLLPARLQRSLGMPRSDAAAELAFGRDLIARLAACADDVVFSWPRREADRELRRSPLLAGIEAATRAPAVVRRYADVVYAAQSLETVGDFRLKPAALGQDVPGGTDLLQQQSACPFRAQAVYRLGAEALEQPAPGVDRRSAGALVHRVLEQLWAGWRSQANLPEPAAARRQIDEALAQQLRRLPPGVRRGRQALLAIERERLQALIEALLEVERQRPSFVVAEREADRLATVGRLVLKIRVDRVDRLDSGGLLVIDYKSGAAELGDWLGERLRAPQLPIYALASGTEVAAIAVASLKAGRVGYIGLGGEDAAAPGIEPVGSQRQAARIAGDWAGLTTLWRRWLEALADEYAAGEAAVQPREPQSCRYCHLTTLCRRHELQTGIGTDEPA